MITKEERPTPTHPGQAGLLYEQDCPVGYNCLATDCMECLEMHADMEGGNNGKAETD